MALAGALFWMACADGGRVDGGGMGGLPRTVALAVQEGGPNPMARTVTLANRGPCALAFDAAATSSDGLGWVSVQPANGVVAPLGSASLALSFDVVRTALPPATYTGTLRVSGICETTGQTARGSPRDVAINLTVVPFTGAPADIWEPLVGEASPAPRTRAVATATHFGTALFGGEDASGDPLAETAVYDPATGWLLFGGLANEPAARVGHTGVYAASEFRGLVVWGGRLADGQLTNTGGFFGRFGDFTWRTVSTANAPGAREDHAAVAARFWVVVWGGRDAAGQVLGDGGRYDINNDGWHAAGISSAGAPASRAKHVAVWTGSEMVVWGGEVAGGAATGDGGRYDPFANTWSAPSSSGAPSARTGMTAVWTGSRMIVWGGRDAGGVLGDGGAYDPGGDTWTPLSSDRAPSAREGHTAVWTGTRMIVWGGQDGSGRPLGDGASYDPISDRWSAVSLDGAPTARSGHVATWQGDRMIVWGGSGGEGVTDTGKSYR
jgi:hypothetical protein